MQNVNKHTEGIKSYPFPYFSYSQLSSFQKCPHSFYLTYVKGLRTTNKYVEVGSLLHSIFEKHQNMTFKQNRKYDVVDAYDEFTEQFKTVDQSLFGNEEDYDNMYKKGLKALQHYFESWTQRNFEMISTEKKLLVKINDELPNFYCVIDTIEVTNQKEITITDYKTGSKEKTKNYLQNDLQLPLYALAIKKSLGIFPHKVRFYHPVPNVEQIAHHIGDGVYQFQTPRKPYPTFSVKKTLATVETVIKQIRDAYTSGLFKKYEEDYYQCKFCFHFEECQVNKPLPKGLAGGWKEVYKYVKAFN